MSTRIQWVTLLTESRTTDVENMTNERHIRWEKDRAYLWVKNLTGVSVSQGAVVYFGMTSDTNFLEIYSLGQSSKGTDGALMAGVVASTAIAATSYGWIQNYGRSDSISFLAGATTAIAVGMAVYALSGQVYATNGTASGTAPIYSRNIISLQALATTVTVASLSKGFIRCLQ